MVGHFFIGEWSGLLWGAGLVALGTAAHLVNAAMSVRGLRQWTFTARLVAGALVGFALTLLFGLVLAADRVWTVPPAGDVPADPRPLPPRPPRLGAADGHRRRRPRLPDVPPRPGTGRLAGPRAIVGPRPRSARSRDRHPRLALAARGRSARGDRRGAGPRPLGARHGAHGQAPPPRLGPSPGARRRALPGSRHPPGPGPRARRRGGTARGAGLRRADPRGLGLAHHRRNDAEDRPVPRVVPRLQSARRPRARARRSPSSPRPSSRAWPSGCSRSAWPRSPWPRSSARCRPSVRQA